MPACAPSKTTDPKHESMHDGDLISSLRTTDEKGADNRRSQEKENRGPVPSTTFVLTRQAALSMCSPRPSLGLHRLQRERIAVSTEEATGLVRPTAHEIDARLAG